MQSERLLSTTLQVASQITGYNEEDLSSTKVRVAEVLVKLGRYEEAKGMLQDELRVSWSKYGMLRPGLLLANDSLAKSLRDTEQLEESLLLSHENVRRYLQDMGATHPDSLVTVDNNTKVMAKLGC